LVEVGVRLGTITPMIYLGVMVVPVVVVPVVETRMGVMVKFQVRGRRDKVSTVRPQVMLGTPVVVGVRVRRGMVETVPVVIIINHTAVTVNSQQ
tara:strand:+ start:158 stop:439 length:282 start_codon:yes stop_codon:yes gene_type:complete